MQFGMTHRHTQKKDLQHAFTSITQEIRREKTNEKRLQEGGHHETELEGLQIGTHSLIASFLISELQPAQPQK